MWVVGVIMMGVMLFGMFAVGGSHHGVMSSRGSIHSVEQMNHSQGQDGGGQHRMMHDQNQGGHDHGENTTGASYGNKEKEKSSSGEARDREGQQPITQNAHSHEGDTFEGIDNQKKM